MTGYYAGIEAGGTKFVCAVGSSPKDAVKQISSPTSTPEETIQQVLTFLHRSSENRMPLSGIGVASFGPIDLNQDSPTYGHITKTPKSGWSHFDLIGAIGKHFDLPIGFDTDVNGAALGEWKWGAAQGLDTFIYLTIGTGIGGGGMVNGSLMHGLIHPEMGHIRIPHDHSLDQFSGSCPYHGDCLEGLANGPALELRWGKRPEQLAVDHPAWDLEAQYLAFGLVNFICTLSPQRIILGGGIMKQSHLYPMIRTKVVQLLNEYVQAPQILDSINEFIVPPDLGNKAGVLGAIALAQQAVIGA